MTVCPVALAVGCKKCPIFAVCPLKSVIGDQPPAAEAGNDAQSDKRKSKPKSRKS